MNDYIVYRHTAPSGKMYIGITCQGLQKRSSGGSGYRECPRFYKAIRKYGWDNFRHEVLYSGLTKEEAEAKEIELIAKYQTTDETKGYNIETGGNCPGTHSEETKRKIGEGNRGKHVSEKTREKLRTNMKGRFVGDANPFYGRHHSEEVRTNQSEFMKGNAYFKGHHHSDEFKEAKSEQMRQKYSNGGNPRCKKVLQVNENGDVVKEYFSLREASRQENITLSAMYQYVKKSKNINGHIWRYE